MTKRRAALLLLAPLTAAAQEPPSLALRLEREGSGPVWLGQHVGITATLRTPIRFASSPLFPELAFQGRAIALPNGTTTPGSERVGAENWVVLQHTYDVFPAEAGLLAIAPVTMTVSVGTGEGDVSAARARSAPLALEVRLPPGTTDPARLVTSRSLHLTVAQEGDPARVPVGEAITRTVTLLAEDSSAMLLPPMPWAVPDGVRAYPDPPRLADRSDRGVLSATRIDRAAFVPQRPGRYELPGATLQWFEPHSGRMQVLAVPPLTVQAVAAAPGEVAVTAPGRRPWRVALGLAGGLTLAAALGWWLRRRQQRPTDPEAEAFGGLRRTCRAGDAPAAMAALLRWAALASPPGAPPIIARLAALAGVPALETEAAALASRRYGPGVPAAGWRGDALLRAARTARHALRRPAATGRHGTGRLPALNPGTEARPAPRVTLPGWAR
ncbi:hypothetical protein RGI145_21510 [Roseomonas gilardii]|uniref:DUF7939 domain-containing protein n=1 Tax=Roseomonas gilardii TaxID=257708 RepID=A0A1L7AM80_9PROT|nr:BatD family protein [Roseomonas gilardii]APT59883.1 hypothetical protein RGI145_21510 [Roseomonas gilardii]